MIYHIPVIADRVERRVLEMASDDKYNLISGLDPSSDHGRITAAFRVHTLNGWSAFGWQANDPREASVQHKAYDHQDVSPSSAHPLGRIAHY
jgi:hypothetical protein